MDQLVQALWGVAAAAVTALATITIPIARTYATNLLQQRLGEGASRIAGEIAAKVAGDPAISAATDAMLAAGAAALVKRFPDTAANLPLSTLTGMIKGELGKMGQGVAPSLPTNLQDRLG
jgi:hypothetical protein